MTSTILESTSVEQRSALFSALGDPIRLRILDELSSGKVCVCSLQEAIEIAPNLLSYHLRVLREAELVVTTRRGRWIDYQLAPTVAPTLRASLPTGLRDDAIQ